MSIFFCFLWLLFVVRFRLGDCFESALLLDGWSRGWIKGWLTWLGRLGESLWVEGLLLLVFGVGLFVLELGLLVGISVDLVNPVVSFGGVVVV